MMDFRLESNELFEWIFVVVLFVVMYIVHIIPTIIVNHFMVLSKRQCFLTNKYLFLATLNNDTAPNVFVSMIMYTVLNLNRTRVFSLHIFIFIFSAGNRSIQTQHSSW